MSLKKKKKENVIIEICIILYSFVTSGRVVVTHVCEYKCVEVCVRAASRKTDECNCSVGSLVKKMVFSYLEKFLQSILIENYIKDLGAFDWKR